MTSVSVNDNNSGVGELADKYSDTPKIQLAILGSAVSIGEPRSLPPLIVYCCCNWSALVYLKASDGVTCHEARRSAVILFIFRMHGLRSEYFLHDFCRPMDIGPVFFGQPNPKRFTDPSSNSSHVCTMRACIL